MAIKSWKAKSLNGDVFLTWVFKSESVLSWLFFKLVTVFLFHFGFSFYFSNAHFENTSLGQLCFPERTRKDIHGCMGGEEEDRDRNPWQLLVAVRVTVEGNTAQGRGKTWERKRERVSHCCEEYLSPPNVRIQPLEGFLFSLHPRGQLSATGICAPLWISRTEGGCYGE